ncbi:uncharacterized protein VP01_795g4 [Puccinia sorghi]|uniref:Uncharacterized protein n=1 Tax=Puccinia sorghi TaxID=27349 RepID=A0A0L6UBJ8_9BASI|nr:uncharacterized protein VP01_795g4 [Puccinia sorghi]
MPLKAQLGMEELHRGLGFPSPGGPACSIFPMQQLLLISQAAIKFITSMLDIMRAGGNRMVFSREDGKMRVGMERRSSRSLPAKFAKGFKATSSAPAKVLPKKTAFKGPSKDFNAAAPPSTDSTPAPSSAEPRPADIPKPNSPANNHAPSSQTSAAQQLHKKDENTQAAHPSSTSEPEDKSKTSDVAKKEKDNDEKSSRTSSLFSGAKKAVGFLKAESSKETTDSSTEELSTAEVSPLVRLKHWGPLKLLKDEAQEADDQEESASS